MGKGGRAGWPGENRIVDLTRERTSERPGRSGSKTRETSRAGREGGCRGGGATTPQPASEPGAGGREAKGLGRSKAKADRRWEEAVESSMRNGDGGPLARLPSLQWHGAGPQAKAAGEGQ